MKIGICGTTGFIGSSLLHAFMDSQEYDLVSFSRTALSANISSSIQTYVWDIDDKDSNFQDFLSSIEVLIYLVDVFDEDIDFLFWKQLVTHKKAVEMIGKSNVKKVIYFSSIAVYGEGYKKKEEEALVPCTNYGYMKMLSEQLFQTLISKQKQLIILRPSSIYGERSRKWVLYHFLEKIRTGQKIHIYGDGEQKREFLFIDDFIDAIKTCISYPKNAIFNLSSPITTSLNEVLSILRERYKLDFLVQYFPTDRDNPIKVLSSDSSFAQKELIWFPETDIITGLWKLIWK